MLPNTSQAVWYGHSWYGNGELDSGLLVTQQPGYFHRPVGTGCLLVGLCIVHGSASHESLRFLFCARLIMVAEPFPQPQLADCRPVFWQGEANRMADFDNGTVRYCRLCNQLDPVWLTLPGSILARAVSESGQAARLSSGQSSEKGTKTVLLRSTAVPSGA